MLGFWWFGDCEVGFVDWYGDEKFDLIVGSNPPNFVPQGQIICLNFFLLDDRKVHKKIYGFESPSIFYISSDFKIFFIKFYKTSITKRHEEKHKNWYFKLIFCKLFHQLLFPTHHHKNINTKTNKNFQRIHEFPIKIPTKKKQAFHNHPSFKKVFRFWYQVNAEKV